MTLKNLTQKTIISLNLKVAFSFTDNLFGLLLSTNQAMLFFTRFGIHTFAMQQKIDVLILDRKNTVVKIKKEMKPNQLFFWNPKYKTVIELPFGTVQESKVKLGDELFWPKK